MAITYNSSFYNDIGELLICNPIDILVKSRNA